MELKNPPQCLAVNRFIRNFAARIAKELAMNRVLIPMTLFLMLAVSCSDHRLVGRMDNIKSVGNSNPKLAMLMLDSIQSEIGRASKYVRMKGMMLEIRLRDKSFLNATTVDSAKLIVEYFDRHGSKYDAAEAHYYAGSAYRDLKDMPHALQHFLLAEKLETQAGAHDSLMLVIIYSNLMNAYFYVQDYHHALEMALKEYDIAKASNLIDPVTLMEVAKSYGMLGDDRMSCKYLKEALDMVLASGIEKGHILGLYGMLQDFSSMKMTEEADSCYALIQRTDVPPYPKALGNYYRHKNKADSAIACYKDAMKASKDLFDTYDAARRLYYTYKEDVGNKDSICKYAHLYIKIADSLDLGKRQEMASTINNQFQYARNIEEEAMIKEENNRIRLWLYTAIGTIVMLSLLFCIYHILRKNRHLNELLELSEQLTETRNDAEALKHEISDYKSQLSKSEESLSATKQELTRVNNEIAHYEEELRHKEQQLAEKLDENRRFILLLHKADLEANAEDVVKAIRKASEGKYTMTSAEWQKLYHAVDELQPDLSEKLAQKIKGFTEQQQQICYLLSIGLSNAQIENLTGLPHVTVWRWVKKFDWI